MRRPNTFLLLSLVGGCSFPTGEFTLRAPGADVTLPPDSVVVDVPPTPDMVAVDAGDEMPPPPDVGPDAPPPDIAPDAPPPDVALDSPPDVAPDAPPDAPPDVPAACPMSFQIRCMGTCINPLNDITNCGVCGRACSGSLTLPDGGAISQNCQLGGCQYPPSARYGRSVPTPAVAFFDACAVGVRQMFMNPDDSSVIVPLPFTFSLFGMSVATMASVAVSTNGFIALQSPATMAITGDIPSSDMPNGVIAPFWSDLILRAPTAAVCVAIDGAPGSRRFVVEWSDVSWYSTATTSPTMTFEVILNEGSNAIDFVYQSIAPRPADPVRSLTIGIENLAGSEAFPVCNSAYTLCGIGAGSRVRLTPAM